MANSQTFVEGLTGGGDQITTLANIQGAGLRLPSPTADFINIRSPGKLRALFESNGNAERLYSINKPEDVGLADALKSRFDYKNPNQGQRSKVTGFVRAATQDANLVRKFMGSGKGTRFIVKQLILQGYQSFDETKVYNPGSPLIAALKPASFGLLDWPTRHIDTSNLIGGIVNGIGLGSVVSTVGALVGGAPAQPPPPRSSVASAASNGIGLSTLTSLVGGGDRSNEVVAPIARGDVKDLLRGNTATNAYNSPRYSRLVSQGAGSFFSRLLSGVGKFIQNNTVVGGILPPKQPWAAKFRADEETYDLYLNAGKLFDANSTGIKNGGILSGLLNSIGFGKRANYSQAVTQRFYNKSKNKPNLSRLTITGNLYKSSQPSTITSLTGEVGLYNGSEPFLGNQITTEKNDNSVSDNSLKYGKLVTRGYYGEQERSDQLLNYKSLMDGTKNFNDTFVDTQTLTVQRLINNLDTSVNTIKGSNEEKYSANRSSLQPLQFAKFGSSKVGMDYLKDLNPNNLNSPNPPQNNTYQGRWRVDETTGNKVPTRLGEGPNDRYIRPTNNVDYVNALEVLKADQFDKLYANTDKFGVYGPDIIKFYFYDIVNKKYIPFNATVKSISDNNNATWETVEYLGRADKLYYYKGFTRSVSFNFTVNAHSIKELMPMWNRINYLVGLTRPANYTARQFGGFMVSPMVQLTLGDFYKNHNVVINSCNVTIPEDAGWETIPEEAGKNGQSWYYGPNKAISWENSSALLNSSIDQRKGNSTGRVAQFPRTADIQIEMSVLEKDLPYVGKAIWGDAPVQIFNPEDIGETGPRTEFYGDKSQDNASVNKFSQNIRYDINRVDQTNVAATP
jgi:hypothetical protein